MDAVEANSRKSSILVPVTVISAILMAVGVVGNVTVMFIIATRMSKKAINCFVFTLASIDLFSCIVCVPIDVVELRNPYLFTFPALCKLLRFTRSLSTTSSGFLLIAIAVERFRLICRYHKGHCSGRQALATCSFVFILALIVSWPSATLFGLKTVALSKDINGTECSISDDFQHSSLPLLYYSLLIILFFGTFISLCVLYALVGFKIWKGRKLKPVRYSTVRSNSISTMTREKINSNPDFASEILDVSPNMFESLRRGTSMFGERIQKKKEYSRRRTTFIMLIMTSVFLVSCLPYIIISICRFLINDLDLHISEAAEVFFHFSLKSFMFSAAVNPYIYGFCNERFKKELLSLSFVSRVNCQPQPPGDASDTSQSPQHSTAVGDEQDKNGH